VLVTTELRWSLQATTAKKLRTALFWVVTQRVKVKVKVNVILQQAMKAQKWSRGITLLFL
jgi:hypothetical protein